MSSIFPFIQPQRYVEHSAALPPLWDVQWDFDNDKPLFTGGKPKYVSGLPAVVSWAYRSLKNPRFQNEIYSFGYGSELQRLIGTEWSQETKTAEAERYVRECLLCYAYITAVKRVTTAFDNGTLTINATLETVYGETEMEVTI